MATYRLTTESVESLTAKTEKLNRKGAGITMTVSPVVVVNIGTERNPVYVDMHDVEIAGRLHYAGWTICASIDHLPPGNVVNIHEPIPESYRTAPSNCDHCNTRRNRLQTIIIRNDATGEYRQIGRNCLAGYIGVDIEDYARYLDCIQFAASESDSTDYDGMVSRSRRMDCRKYLAYTVAITARVGYVSRTRATETGAQSTESLVWSIINQTSGKVGQANRDYLASHGITDAVLADADATIPSIMAWLLSCTDTSDYIRNLQTIFAEYSDIGYIMIDKKHLAYALSVCAAYNRATAKAAEQVKREAAPAPVSIHVGTVGQKITFTGSVKYISSYDTQYGITRIYRMIDTTGNVFTWFSSSYVDDSDHATITGTVKAHDEYRGTKQTVLTRCKIA